MNLQSMLNKPQLFVAGAPKCASTAWVSYLATNPQIHFGTLKEPNYFNRDLKWRRSCTAREYRNNYQQAPDDAITADASVLYLFSNTAPELIHAFNPNAKILILLRDHLSFLRSWHNELRYHGMETTHNVEDAWALIEERRCGQKVPARCTDRRLLDYAHCATFADHLKRFLELFPEDQVCILWLDQWKKNPQRYFEAVQKFAGVTPVQLDSFTAVGTARQHRKQWVGWLLNLRPPRAWLDLYFRLRSRLGMHGRNRFLYRLRQANLKEAEIPAVSEEFATQIRSQYRADLDFVMVQVERSNHLLGAE